METLKNFGLSDREIQVANLVAEGNSNAEIAFKLNIVEKTVKFHTGSIYKKMNVTGRAQFIVKTLRMSLPKSEGAE